MIPNLLVNLIVLILGAIFSFLPAVTVLPHIVGYDIDSALVSGMGNVNMFFSAFWAVGIMFQGFLAILIYIGIKMGAKAFLGHRVPGK